MQASSLFQSDIIKKLKFGRPPNLSHLSVFREVISSEYESICAYFGCLPKINDIDLLKAQDHWIDDMESLPIAESTEPDHFKHAGWLCHWLRKKQPITQLTIHDDKKMEDWFEDSYNEVCAFVVGLKLVIFHECCEYDYSNEQIVKAAKRGAYIDILPDVALYLDHKNVSPHAIYLIYKAAMHSSPLDVV